MAGGLRGVSCRPPSDLTSDIGPATALALGDIDGDGDVDLFKSAGPSQQAQLLLNAGNGSFHLEPESPDEATGAALLDLENDGDLDLVTAQPTLPYNNRSNGLLTPYDEAPAMRGETVVVLDYLAWMVRRTCCSATATPGFTPITTVMVRTSTICGSSLWGTAVPVVASAPASK